VPGTDVPELIPALEWREIRDHLAEQLMFDEQWIEEAPDRLTWQPWAFPTTISISDRIGFQDGSGQEALRITISTPLMAMRDELDGSTLCEALNETAAFGSFVWTDGAIHARAAFLLNPLSRSLLPALHTAVLIQSTNVHQAAPAIAKFHADEGLPEPRFFVGHPTLGMREEPDELLSIYAGPDCSLPMQAEMMALWREAAPLFVEKIAAFGLAAVNVDETQCSVASDSLLVTLTPLDDPEGSGQYGMGVHISTTVNFSTNGEPDPTDVNALNAQLGVESQLDNLGHVSAFAFEQGWVPQLTTFIPTACWAGYASDADSLAAAMVNIVLHASLPADQLS